MEQRPPYSLIKDNLERGFVVPFLGAGASLVGRAANEPWRSERRTFLPRGAELATFLAKKAEFPGETDDLLAVAQYYYDSGGREPLKRVLYSVFASDTYPLGALHKYLAGIKAPLILVTTNYDDLLERAFAARPYHLVVHTTDEEYGEEVLWRKPGMNDFIRVNPKRLDLDPATETVIYKMHGTVMYGAGSGSDEELTGQYVITEDDYVDFLTRLSKGKALPAALAEPFEKRHFLFLGYALRDWNFRVVLNRVQTKARRLQDIKSWAIDAAPSQLEQAFWQGRGVLIYKQAIDAFVENLRKA